MPLDMNSSRRLFITQGLGLIGMSAAVPTFLARSASAADAPDAEQRILVMVQLSGGHDGLSAVVPYGDDNYNKLRKASHITGEQVLKIDEHIGLHPNLKGFKSLLDEGKFAVVQGVGYPNPNQSHFTSMDIWHLADNNARTNDSTFDTSRGWLGKYTDHCFTKNLDPKLAMAIGSGKAPLAIRGHEHPGLSFQVPESFRYTGDRGDKRRAEAYQQLNMDQEAKASAMHNLEFVTATAANANASSDEIRAVATKYKTKSPYPRSGLASSLQTVASLIAGGLSTRIYYVFHGGYDTHSGQRSRHDRLMTELGDAVAAFQKDLDSQGNGKRVLTMCFSEFGRRPEENFSEGTDHGMAGPMFLIGGGVKPGLHGKHPSLAKEDLVLGRDLKFEIDFRSVYATALASWLSAPAEPILGGKFPLLDIV